MSQAFSLYTELTVRQNLELHARLFHLPTEQIPGRMSELIERFGLYDYVDELAAKLKMYRNHGSSQPYHHDVIGYNSRLDELQAVILRIKLRHIDEYNQGRKRVALSYNQPLADSKIITPIIPQDHDHVFHQYTVLADNREEIRQHLLSKQIACAVYYPIPLHRQQAFADAPAVSLPVTEDISQRCVSFPIFPEMSEQQIETVCRAVLEVA